MRAAYTYRSARRAAAIATRAILRKMKREEKAAAYAKNGLNGPRAVKRRKKQIKAGSLKTPNGLTRAKKSAKRT